MEYYGTDPLPCTDYLKLNSVFSTEYFPLPNIEDGVKKVAATRFNTVIYRKKRLLKNTGESQGSTVSRIYSKFSRIPAFSHNIYTTFANKRILFSVYQKYAVITEFLTRALKMKNCKQIIDWREKCKNVFAN